MQAAEPRLKKRLVGFSCPQGKFSILVTKEENLHDKEW
jgi:hypothetical protein